MPLQQHPQPDSTAGGEELVYRLNAQDELVYVSEDWDRFALRNEGEAVRAERVLRRSLWEFVEDLATRELYRQLLKRARQGSPARFRFRCDSPTQRRLLEMEITGDAEGLAEFRTRLLSRDNRPRQELLQAGLSRSGELICVCGWCARVEVEGAWLPVEEAVPRLRLFESGPPPQLSHGICPECSAEMYRKLSLTASEA